MRWNWSLVYWHSPFWSGPIRSWKGVLANQQDQQSVKVFGRRQKPRLRLIAGGKSLKW